ncbi:MAG: hypothetical protein OXI38_04655 [Bacteroidota bacterium]|nr:hypothetical protein [Bacteroidota bacterium]
MKSDIFDHLIRHYASVAEELRSKAQQAAVLGNPTGIGTEREEIYRIILERYLPKQCDVFLGGYLFDRNGESSAQLDVIATAGNTLRFQMPEGNRHIAPLEGSIAVVEVKSRLDKNTLLDALEKFASIPPMPASEGIVAPHLRVPEDRWRDMPYKIVFAYDGIHPSTLRQHIQEYYDHSPAIPIDRNPNLIHVLGKYLVVRTTGDMRVIAPDGQPDPIQPGISQYKTFMTSPDISALAWIFNELHQQAFLSSHLLFKYGQLYNKLMERILREMGS